MVTKMKKHLFITSVVMVLALALALFMFVSCGKPGDNENSSSGAALADGMTAKQLFLHASQKRAEFKNYTSLISSNVTYTSTGISGDMTQTGTLKVEDGEDGLRMSMTMTTSIDGMDQTLAYYYFDGFYYSDYFGAKMKVAMSNEEARIFFNNMAGSGGEVSLEGYKNIVKTKNQNGTWTVSGSADKIDGDSALLDDIIANIGLTGDDISFGGMSFELVTSGGGDMLSNKTTFGFTANFGEVELDYQIEMIETFKDIGTTAADININIEEYQDYSDMSLE